MTQSVFTNKYRRLRELMIKARHNANLKQKELSLILNKHNSFVCKYEIGERRLDVVELIWIAKTLKADPVEIFKEILNTPD